MDGITLNTAGTEAGAASSATVDDAAIERLRIADVPLAELEGLPLFEQFLKVWGAPERGQLLWQQWYESQNETGRGVLDLLVAEAMEQQGLTEEEAKHRLAVEKYVTDRGTPFATKFMEGYWARKLNAASTLQPMAVRPKKKR